MPFSLVGWAKAAPGAAAIAGVTKAINDGLYTGGTGNYITARPKDRALLGLWYGVESTPGYVRLKQASMKYPITALVGNDMEGGILKPLWNDYRFRPISIKPNEDILAQTFNATDEDTMIVAALADGAWPNPPFTGGGDIFTLRGTSTTTQVALTWTPVTVTWSEALEQGKFAVLGLKAWVYKAANPGYAAVRIVGLEDTDWRPGCIAPTIGADGTSILQPFDEHFGEWPEMRGIQFSNTAMPSLEMLGLYANTSIVCEMKIRKIS